jgi:hypothetical protein
LLQLQLTKKIHEVGKDGNISLRISACIIWLGDEIENTGETTGHIRRIALEGDMIGRRERNIIATCLGGGTRGDWDGQ